MKVLLGQVAIVSILILGGHCVSTGAELPAGWAKSVLIRTGEEVGGAKWHMSLVDGELGFCASGVGPIEPNAKPIPTEAGQLSIAGIFTLHGAKLRIDVPKEQREIFEEQKAKHGFYLTADYSTDPPSVILTKKPTKYSEWKFEKIRREDSGLRGYIVYVQNDNDLDKPAWLSMEDKGFRCYKGGTELRKPILSKKKTPFFVAVIDVINQQ